MNQRMWWPLELSPREQAACEAFVSALHRAPPRLDMEAIATSEHLLARAMRGHIATIVERDTLPHYGHLLNGWGNARWQGQHLLDGLSSFVHRRPSGEPYILQRDPEGEFHPWQSFAYAIMAGADPARPIAGVGASLRELALQCTVLNTDDPCELGHLLYALAHMELPADIQITMGARSHGIDELIELAIDAHYDGHFKVCRKVHLTEGICAAALLRDWARDDAEGFLAGQLDILIPLGAALTQARLLEERGERAVSGSLISELRDTLVIEAFLENHYYLAGHLIELAGLAWGMGYQIEEQHWLAMRFVVNELNRILPRYLPQTAFPGCFLHFGHYRRAITLLAEAERARAAGHRLGPGELSRFTVDFDVIAAADAIVEIAPEDDGIFAIAQPENEPRPSFLAAVDAYARIAGHNLHPRGSGIHFRRVLVPGWPRWLHYELLDYGAGMLRSVGCAGAGIGIEVHIESPEGHSLAPHLNDLLDTVAQRFSGHCVDWDPTWWRGGGRLRVCFAPEAAAEDIAAGLAALIERTAPALQAAMDAARRAA